ncbi:hypothetical protein CMK18_20890 [Candidatus Poribacteria bacterium]|nr:hypothetical protein [Candidatus Poribacteria bacterium]
MDSILINTPISSPLHPQANLPLLKKYILSKGFKTKIIDSNIMFYHWFLGGNPFNLTDKEDFSSPIQILSVYDNIAQKLHEKSQNYEGLSVGLRHLNMKHDRVSFDGVLASIIDEESNPFIQFYKELIEEKIVKTRARILGIAVTFQDQLIPVFTLAKLIREQMPETKIVMGGQIITRCYDTMVQNQDLSEFYDYLSLWDGEKNLLDIHLKVIGGREVSLVNTLDMSSENNNINRVLNSPAAKEIPSTDFTDIDFNDYFLPEMLVPIQTTRGCYAKCDFCAIPFGANGYKVRKVDQIIEEIIQIQEDTLRRFGKKATFFKFMEDTSAPSLLHELAVEIEKRGLDVKWETFARLEKGFAKNGFMEQLYRGGCRKFHWGLESNDPDVLLRMKKKTNVSYANEILRASAEAGILNFCFVLVGFPTETDAARENMTQYLIENRDIHTITISTFDLTKGSPMEQDFVQNNSYNLDMRPAEDFQVRLPYTVNGQNWKAKIIPVAHKMMLDIVRERPDIGFMTLFPDQIRAMYCDKYTNQWGQIFLDKYGADNIKNMMANTEKYVKAYQDKREIDPSLLPEPLRREHFRTKEDLRLIASAIIARKNYEGRRVTQL